MKIMFISLGCDKNLVDTEYMLGILKDKGFEFTDDEMEAEVIVINTCCFIHDAKQESINTIIEMAEHKQDACCKVLLVSGCLAQRYQDEIIKEIPEVDAIIGTSSYDKIAEVILSKLLKNDLLYVCLIYVIGVILYAVLGNFSKTAIAIYNDEFFYWDMARNIFHGKGPVITGVDTTFDKAAYSVLIAPFFAITDVVLRVRVLGVFNCMVMMSSLFPLWLLAKKLDLKRSSMLCLLCVTALSSDMLLTMTFMSEILYWPLFIWFICLWFINVKEPTTQEEKEQRIVTVEFIPENIEELLSCLEAELQRNGEINEI